MANWNTLLEEIAEGGKGKYPNTWSESYEATLNDQQRKEYWAHLRGLGLTAHKDRLGKTIDWVLKNVLKTEP